MLDKQLRLDEKVEKSDPLASLEIDCLITSEAGSAIYEVKVICNCNLVLHVVLSTRTH